MCLVCRIPAWTGERVHSVNCFRLLFNNHLPSTWLFQEFLPPISCHSPHKLCRTDDDPHYKIRTPGLDSIHGAHSHVPELGCKTSGSESVFLC